MAIEFALGIVAEAVVGYLLDKSGILERLALKTGFKRDDTKAAFEAVYQIALEEVAKNRPDNLLTKHAALKFWQDEATTALLSRYFAREKRPTPDELSAAWFACHPASDVDVLPLFRLFDKGLREAFRDPHAPYHETLLPFVESQDEARAANNAEAAARDAAEIKAMLGEMQRSPAPKDTISVDSINDSEKVVVGTDASTTYLEYHSHTRPLLDEAPAPPHLDEALARLDEMPTTVPPPDPQPLPRGSRMGLTPNPDFVGRAAELVQLALDLKAGRASAIGQVVAASGFGGIGKTQLAAEFAHRYGHYFAGGVYWLSFEAAANVPSEVAACGFDMAGRPRSFHSLSQEEQVRWVRAQWQSPLPRLLIFDNCESPELLQAWRPSSGGARLLLTTRRNVWPRRAGVTLRPLATLPRHESIALLRRFRPDLNAADAAWDGIADALGDLPLALHLAGSYLAQYADIEAGDPSHYLAALEARLLAHPSMMAGEATATDHEPSVAATFEISVDQLDETEEAGLWARALLARAAHFAAGEPLPHHLLLATLPSAEPEAAANGLRRLLEVGLLMPEDDRRVTIHRLVAHYATERLADEQALNEVEQAVLNAAHKDNQSGFPARLQVWEAHLRHVTEQALRREDEREATLATNLGYHLSAIGAYGAAEPLYARALGICEAQLGADHPDTASSLNNLAGLYESQGRYEAAEPLYERALGIREAQLGAEHPTTANSLNNLAYLYKRQGRYEAAEPLYERALGIYEAQLGADHPDMAQSLNNLAGLYASQGRYGEAEPLYARALGIMRARLGGNHPNTQMVAMSLAGLRMQQQMANRGFGNVLQQIERKLRASGPDKELERELGKEGAFEDKWQSMQESGLLDEMQRKMQESGLLISSAKCSVRTQRRTRTSHRRAMQGRGDGRAATTKNASRCGCALN